MGDDAAPHDEFWTGLAPDPFAAADPKNAGTRGLLACRDALAAGDVPAALDAASQARSAGVPAELVPHLHVLEGASLMLNEQLTEAAATLADGWRNHPDIAALPALLGVARALSGDHRSSTHAMYASLISDDPDASLAVHRRLLDRFFAPVQQS